MEPQPLEERWEALDECERLSTAAEARIGATDAMLVQMPSGLELLRVGGMSDLDIANWRYGRRILTRQNRLVGMLPLLALVALGLGLGAWELSGARIAGIYTTVITAVMLFNLWREPPRLWIRIADGSGGRRTLWPWQRQRVRLAVEPRTARPSLLLPRLRGELRLQGADAAMALASLLPKLNGADCTAVRLSDVLNDVASAERESGREPRESGRRRRRRRKRGPDRSVVVPARRQPWELIAFRMTSTWLTLASPASRLALEMAVTEAVERQQLHARAEQLSEEWYEEEEVGAISDDLLLPETVTERLREMHSRARKRGGSGPSEQ